MSDDPGPAGGRVPAGFDPLSFTSISLDEWWVYGTAHCLTGHGSCGAIVRTTDGGATWAGIPSPPVGASSVTQLRFAGPLSGYAFGPQLWITRDGGSHWSRVLVPGSIMELEAADGYAFALSCVGKSNSCQQIELLRAPAGSSAFRVMRLPIWASYGSQFAVSRSSIYVMVGPQRPELLESTDRGASFHGIADPCRAGLGGSVATAADGTPTLWAACPTGMMAQVLESTDGGAAWRLASGGAFPNSLRLAAASNLVALAWPEGGTQSLALTSDGGKSFRVVLPAPAGNSVVRWAGYSDPARAYAIVSSLTGGALYESNDGGSAWRAVTIH